MRPFRVLATVRRRARRGRSSRPTGAADPPGTPVVLHSGQVTRQDVAVPAGSEPDTVVEPDVAVNPTEPRQCDRRRARLALSGRRRGRHLGGWNVRRRRELAARAGARDHHGDRRDLWDARPTRSWPSPRTGRPTCRSSRSR